VLESSSERFVKALKGTEYVRRRNRREQYVGRE
jgi:hypothetical protein